MARSCKHGNKPSGCTTDGEFHDRLSDYQLRKLHEVGFRTRDWISEPHGKLTELLVSHILSISSAGK
jgi:hypothetical protein